MSSPEELNDMLDKAIEENVALEAENATLKAENEGLKDRLATACHYASLNPDVLIPGGLTRDECRDIIRLIGGKLWLSKVLKITEPEMC